MANNVIRCPNCGGDVDVNTSKNVIECPYCNSDIVNTFFDNKKDDMIVHLTLAKRALEHGNISEFNINLDRASIIESDCSDIWYMKAAMYSVDADTFKIHKDRASNAKVNFGIFTETDMAMYRNANVKMKKNFTRMWFGIAGFIIFFIGGSLALGLGIGFETIVPAVILVILLILLFMVYIVVVKSQERR